MSLTACPWERFPALEEIPGLRHAFLMRVPGADVKTLDKEEALRRLKESHQAALRELGLADWPLITGEQVHGADVLVVKAGDAEDLSKDPVPGVDGFVTGEPGIGLGIYVADCAAVYLVDPVHRVLGLVHSGRKGTEEEITLRAIATMVDSFGSRPSDLMAVVSPCIRPPDYEVDFAAQIREQCRAAGLKEASICDAGTSTSSDLDRYYSYRMEEGRTGRMLAVLGWDPKQER